MQFDEQSKLLKKFLEMYLYSFTFQNLKACFSSATLKELSTHATLRFSQIQGKECYPKKRQVYPIIEILYKEDKSIYCYMECI